MRLALIFPILLAVAILAGGLVGRTVAGSSKSPDTLVSLSPGTLTHPLGHLVQDSRIQPPNDPVPHNGQASAVAELPLSTEGRTHTSALAGPLPAGSYPVVNAPDPPPSHATTGAERLGVTTAFSGGLATLRVIQVSQGIPSRLTLLPALPGDVNLDLVVDELDLRIVAGALGTIQPQPPEADINGDGRVDVLDLAIASLHLGETLP